MTGKRHVALVGACLLAPQVAHAHPFAAEPPAFDNDACIVVLDKREQDSWHLEYRVPVEDTIYDPDLIELPDTKTHQFLAVQGYVRADGMGHVFLPFGESEPMPMPTWLTHEDVQRAEAAVDSTLVEWHADMLTDADVVEANPEVRESLFPFTGEPLRVPITLQQGMQGVDWDLTDVPPGGYQIVSHTFSPPYNSWTPRPGLVKVVDGTSDPVVVTLRPVGANLFAGQGRRITGCVDAPDGSTVQLAVRKRSAEPGEFETWLEEQPIHEGEYELCLQNPGMDATLEVRVEVRTPEGEVAAAYAEEVIAMFQTSAPCLKNETRCCPPTEADSDGGVEEDAGQADAGQDQPRDAGDDKPRTTVSDAGQESPDADEGAEERGSSREGSGCSSASERSSPALPMAPLLIALMLTIGRRASSREVTRG